MPIQGLEIRHEDWISTRFVTVTCHIFLYSSLHLSSIKGEEIGSKRTNKRESTSKDRRKRATLANQREQTLIDIHRAYIGISIVFIYSLYYKVYIVIFLYIGLGWLVGGSTTQVRLGSNAYVGTPIVVGSTSRLYDWWIVCNRPT